MYINFQTFKKTLLVGSLVSFVALTSCKKDDNTPVPPPSAEGANFFIDAGGDQNKTRYLLVAKNVENGKLPLSANQEQYIRKTFLRKNMNSFMLMSLFQYMITKETVR